MLSQEMCRLKKIHERVNRNETYKKETAIYVESSVVILHFFTVVLSSSCLYYANDVAIFIIVSFVYCYILH